jgi:hypothetical protein
MRLGIPSISVTLLLIIFLLLLVLPFPNGCEMYLEKTCLTRNQLTFYRSRTFQDVTTIISALGDSADEVSLYNHARIYVADREHLYLLVDEQLEQKVENIGSSASATRNSASISLDAIHWVSGFKSVVPTTVSLPLWRYRSTISEHVKANKSLDPIAIEGAGIGIIQEIQSIYANLPFDAER